MINRSLFFLLFVSLCLSTSAQSDSAHFVHATITTQKLAKGVYWKQLTFSEHDLFGANEHLSWVEVTKKAKKYRLNIVPSDSLERTSQIAMQRNALAGVNGSFFKMRGPDPDNRKDLNGVPQLERSLLPYNRSEVYLREDGSLVASNLAGKQGQRRRSQQGAIVINGRTVQIVENNPDNLRFEDGLQGSDILSTGPILLIDNKNFPIIKDAFSTDRHPRTAFGIRSDGTLVLFVVDGRAAESAGFSIEELQQVMRWLGCANAINLDGGGSTAMYIKGQPDNGVVSHPSDNKKYDHFGEREVANVLLLLKK